MLTSFAIRLVLNMSVILCQSLSDLAAFAMKTCSMKRKSNHLRHSKFAGLREDKDARTVIKEHGGEG